MLLDGCGFLLAKGAPIWQRINMKSAARLLGVIILLLLLAIGISFLLPAQARHTRVLTLKQTPEAVFTVLSDVEKFPAWNRNVEKVERLPPIDGKEAKWLSGRSSPGRPMRRHGNGLKLREAPSTQSCRKPR